jgi:hypothetical protein
MANQIPKIVGLFAFTALSGAALTPAAAQIPIKLKCLAGNLTGAWEGNDGGLYRVHQKKNTITWVGMSSDHGDSWTHIFIGYRNGDEIKGEWADVNGPMGEGKLTLHVRGNGKFLVRSAASGSGFSGARWRKRGC